MNITESIKYIGVNDHTIDLFESQYEVPNGMSYNSYVILDEKIAVVDSVEAGFGEEWLNNLKKALNGRKPDYLIVQHMEPDHSSSMELLIKEYPGTAIVASAMSFTMMKNFFSISPAENKIVVAEGGRLSLGKRELTFFTAPMVHWPEVIVTYDSFDKVLFSADAFGKFGALDIEDDWISEARRYYMGIVGKFGFQVQALLKKLCGLKIEKICSLHGPVLTENICYYLELYTKWSSYEVESDGVMIAYTSVYGNTRKAAEMLYQQLIEKGCPKVVLNDLARCDMSEAVSDAFRFGKIVLATTTYNSEIFPFMRVFIGTLVEHNFQNRMVAFIENGSWASVAAKTMKTMLEKCKNLTFANNLVSIKSAVNEDNIKQIAALAEELK